MADKVDEKRSGRRYPLVPIQELNLKAAPFFEEAAKLDRQSPQARILRRKGMNVLRTGAEAYIRDNHLEAEYLKELRTSELVFLFSNLQSSKIPEISETNLFHDIWDECDERIGLASDRKWKVSPRERAALLKYCHAAQRFLPSQNFRADCYHSQVKHYSDAILALEASRRPQKKEERIDLKPQKTIVNATAPLSDPVSSVREKNYGDALSQSFKKIAPAYGIRLKRTDTKQDDFIRYDLYPWTKREEDHPTGSLTIHNDKKITLASEEFEHFIATAKMLKEAGHDEIVLQRLSKNPDEAMAFAANMVAAGQIAGIKVEQPYSLQELQKYNPRLASPSTPEKTGNTLLISPSANTR